MRNTTAIWLLIALTTSCGDSNILSTLDPPPASQRAARMLEDGDSDDAIELVLDTLEGSYRTSFTAASPNNANLETLRQSFAAQLASSEIKGEGSEVANLLAILSSAVAQKAGIDTLDIVLKLASASGSDDGEENSMVALFPVLPQASESNIHGTRLAAKILESLGSQLKASDKFRLGLYITASTALSVKALDTNGDQHLSEDELLGLSASSATAIVASLASAVVSLSGQNSSENPRSTAAQTAVVELRDEIQGAPGSTDLHRLRNYLEVP